MTDTARDDVARATEKAVLDAIEKTVAVRFTAKGRKIVAAAAIAAYEAAQWRPIEEAPTDGTFFLVCCGKWRPFVAHFYRGTLVSDQGEDGLIAYPATHFCPIPPPPENEG
jgi:hypothetical protein